MSYIKTLINKCKKYLKKKYKKIKPKDRIALRCFFLSCMVGYFAVKRWHWQLALIFILFVIFKKIRSRVLHRRKLDKQDNMK